MDGQDLFGPIVRERQPPGSGDNFYMPAPWIAIDVKVARLRANTTSDFDAPRANGGLIVETEVVSPALR